MMISRFVVCSVCFFSSFFDFIGCSSDYFVFVFIFFNVFLVFIIFVFLNNFYFDCLLFVLFFESLCCFLCFQIFRSNFFFFFEYVNCCCFFWNLFRFFLFFFGGNLFWNAWIDFFSCFLICF